ncbi:hypothetical protein SAMD00019534_072100 [Acytostelium subglobosum LB1]|uniref:hypothetical protein n=1 Tax=Acytostelium subglobosum LB1 TaxID=1410327 RepID=UPI000644C45B|nr:hypothetical protein SAMD00019534_072100 [Acytostelium subglobosum LB1]GAM24035.1 hypothetical protein SAMD00019534_072100 [Acytostelium subglobosum LB1]|eukprot:XP_012753071.1 hypothetical protein SAMD00019534_072100 [Acytostelium subglobosum LB1]
MDSFLELVLRRPAMTPEAVTEVLKLFVSRHIKFNGAFDLLDRLLVLDKPPVHFSTLIPTLARLIAGELHSNRRAPARLRTN